MTGGRGKQASGEAFLNSTKLVDHYSLIQQMFILQRCIYIAIYILFTVLLNIYFLQENYFIISFVHINADIINMNVYLFINKGFILI